MTLSLSRTLMAGVASLALLSGPALADEAPAFDFGAMTDAQKEAFGAAVRDYIMSDPQIVMDAVAELERIENELQVEADLQLVSANMDALINDGFSWVGGNPEGDITIVEFLDYRCGFCRRAHPEVTQLIESDGNIRLIVKELPILGEASLVASRFAVAAHIIGGDDAYKAAHDAMIALEGDPAEPQLRRIANTLGLDADAILAEMTSDEVNRRIGETRALAQALQINGTPSFVLGNQMMRGFAPADAMRAIVEEQRG